MKSLIILSVVTITVALWAPASMAQQSGSEKLDHVAVQLEAEASKASRRAGRTQSVAIEGEHMLQQAPSPQEQLFTALAVIEDAVRHMDPESERNATQKRLKALFERLPEIKKALGALTPQVKEDEMRVMEQQPIEADPLPVKVRPPVDVKEIRHKAASLPKAESEVSWLEELDKSVNSLERRVGRLEELVEQSAVLGEL